MAAESAPPRIIGHGAISTKAPEFAWSETLDGREAYFNRATLDDSTPSILVTRRTRDGWSAPEVVPFSGIYRDADPFITADGARLFFSSNRPRPGEDAVGDYNLWVVHREGAGWSEPVILPEPINTGETEIYSTLSRDGVLYFNSTRSGHRLIYRAAPVGEGFGVPELVTLSGPAGERPGNPAISPDGDTLVFVDTGEESPTAGDLFMSRRRGDRWSMPERLPPPINSEWADFAPCFSPDGASLTFTSERPGLVSTLPEGVRPPGDLYRVAAP